jgi:hypothetical protein
MHRHTKLAILVAPFLLVGGYIASDLYLDYQAKQKRVFTLSVFGHCDVIHQKCILKSADFEINVFDKEGVTTVNSTFPLDSATLFLVKGRNDVQAYPLGMSDSPYYWQHKTPLRSLIPNKGDSVKLRLIAKIKGGQYISEFYSQTSK